MCGIAGIIQTNRDQFDLQAVQRMTDMLQHRGPDGAGHWQSGCGRVLLGHRRLSVIDLSEAGHQPMHYGKRYTIVFNGAIYNYIELRDQLSAKGHSFRSQSDTEVLLAMYAEYKENCLPFLDGMFAFAIYDRQEATVFMARDRFGEKPFFYTYLPGGYFAFASEMKSLWAMGTSSNVNEKMLYNYLVSNLLINPNDPSETFYQHISRLPQASYAIIKPGEPAPVIKRYWDIETAPRKEPVTLAQAQEQFKEYFYTSVKRRLRSDVAIGSSLSGGLDSSVVVGVINELNKGQSFSQQTFSARFPGFDRDEGPYIDEMVSNTHARAFATFPTAKTTLDAFEKICYHQEEPFGSASIAVQYAVMQLAKENQVTVLLDGQGADEILAGYHHYYPFFFNELRSDAVIHKQQVAAYRTLHAGNTVNKNITKGAAYYLRQYAPGGFRLLKKMRNRLRQQLQTELNSDFYHAYRGNDFETPYGIDTLNGQLRYETMNELSVLLRYADRNSMAHSRELRLPFLNHELVEFIFSLPASFKINDGWTKYLLRTSFQSLLPESITWRKEKIGYEPPQKNWMAQNEFRDMVLSGREVLVNHHFLDKKILSRLPAASAFNERGDNAWSHLVAGKTLFQAL
jgi:asparagine synthase (glutamine-hydrolysing)